MSNALTKLFVPSALAVTLVFAGALFNRAHENSDAVLNGGAETPESGVKVFKMPSGQTCVYTPIANFLGARDYGALVCKDPNRPVARASASGAEKSKYDM